MSLVVLAGLALVACGGGADADGDSKRKFLGASELCEGAFSLEGAAALRTVTGAELFYPSPEGEGVPTVAADLEHDFLRRAPFSPEHTLCSVYRKGGNDFTDASLRFSLAGKHELDTSDLASNQHPYAMGKLATAGLERSYLFFECVSPRLPGSAESPALIGGEISDRHPPEKESRLLWEASLTALHSGALALAKELGCVRDGGLPPKATFIPVPAR
ncbi:hypothetical protein ACFWBX_32615 [Streptomyces sp. NPDC059991]|uniref:hypothetical protein n=1 Tax=Streptomyces sp. NPDC059991 TaxID=3347028 RepID=UPI0036BEF866